MLNIGDQVMVDPNSPFLDLMRGEGLQLNKIYTIIEIFPALYSGKQSYKTDGNTYGYNEDCFILIPKIQFTSVQIEANYVVKRNHKDKPEIDYLEITKSLFKCP